jgi:hypothetical protein
LAERSAGQIHLEEPILAVCKAKGPEGVRRSVGFDHRDAVRIAAQGRRRLQTRQVQFAIERRQTALEAVPEPAEAQQQDERDPTERKCHHTENPEPTRSIHRMQKT